MDAVEKIECLFNLLQDGEPHLLNEISAQKPLLKTPISNLIQVLNVFEEYGFIEITQNEESNTPFIEVKLSEPVLAFIREIRWVESRLWTI